jgi:hypothetical protein
LQASSGFTYLRAQHRGRRRVGSAARRAVGLRLPYTWPAAVLHAGGTGTSAGVLVILLPAGCARCGSGVCALADVWGTLESVTTVVSNPKTNQLLAALPDAEWQRWLPQLETVALPLGKVLYESGNNLTRVYFPSTAIVSLLYVMEDGASAEIAVVGHEGIVGISLFMGVNRPRTARWCKALGRGSAWRRT